MLALKIMNWSVICVMLLKERLLMHTYASRYCSVLLQCSKYVYMYTVNMYFIYTMIHLLCNTSFWHIGVLYTCVSE